MRSIPLCLLLLALFLAAGCSGGSGGGSNDDNSPVVAITSPPSGSNYLKDEPITFEGTGIDAADGTLDDPSLVWVSDLDGELGSGSELTLTTLSRGVHTIALYATDSSGNTGSATIETIIHSIPVFSLDKSLGGDRTDYARSMDKTTEGGFIFTGYSNSFTYEAEYGNIYLVKTDADGNILWQKVFGGDKTDDSYCVRETSDNGFITVGYSATTGQTGVDIYLLKVDSSGDMLWERFYGGDSYEYGYSVSETTDNGFIIAGATGSYGAGHSDMYLIRTDAAGEPLWEKTFGGAGFEAGYSVIETTDGGFIVAGAISSYGAGQTDIYLVKTNASGEVLWEKTIGGTGSETGYSVIETTDGDFVIAGTTSSYGYGGTDVYLVKIDKSGEVLWEETFGGIDFDYGNSVIEENDGGLVVVGSSASFGAESYNIYLIKTTSSGDLIWEVTFGDLLSNYGYSVLKTTDGGYAIAGSKTSDLYFLKLSVGSD